MAKTYNCTPVPVAWVSSPYTANQNSCYHPERPLPVPHVEYDANAPPCGLCEEGKWHPICVGPQPELHPCLRVWGACKYSDSCVFKNLPRTWCLYCCRRAEHRQCNGVPPEDLPNVGDDIQRKCKDHAGQMKEKFQARREKVRLQREKAMSESGTCTSINEISSECDSVGHSSSLNESTSIEDIPQLQERIPEEDHTPPTYNHSPDYDPSSSPKKKGKGKGKGRKGKQAQADPQPSSRPAVRKVDLAVKSGWTPVCRRRQMARSP